MENTPKNQRPLWQWALLGLVSGGFLFLVFNIFFRNPRTRTSSDQSSSNISYNAPLPPGSDLYITVDSKGFSPNNVTIPPGINVIWQNKTDKSIEIASNPHPSHSDNPTLNIGVILPGESKSLVLPVVGAYEYHNHLKSSRKGVIIVKLPEY